MLIKDYEVEVFTPPCNPNAEQYAARARLNVDISAVLPYLNATLRGALYLPEAKALTWKKGNHKVAFHSFEIAISNVEDRETAARELEALIDLINRTWDQRAEIVPDTFTHLRPSPLAIYKLLPNTNCKECGEVSCYAFAVKLAASQKQLEDCRPLSQPQYAERLTALHKILSES